MRLWSIHPEYLDATGLVACWREGLLARKVLAGGTRGYRNHPQLTRFRDAAEAIDTYLAAICDEAQRRGYNFDRSKISAVSAPVRLKVTRGQLDYEFVHLKQKLQRRHPAQYEILCRTIEIKPHPMFDVTGGDIETWEVMK